LARPSAQLGVARRGVDDLGGIERERLGHHAAPAQVVRSGDHLAVGAGRPRTEHERVVELHAIDGDAEVGHVASEVGSEGVGNGWASTARELDSTALSWRRGAARYPPSWRGGRALAVHRLPRPW